VVAGWRALQAAIHLCAGAGMGICVSGVVAACWTPAGSTASSAPATAAGSGAAATGLASASAGSALSAADAAAAAAAALAHDAPPELAPVAWTRVGRGQEIHFGLDVVDPEGDTVRVTLTKKPPEAIYRPLTLTVLWRPGPADGARAQFEVAMHETLRHGGYERDTVVGFAIDVVDAPVAPPAPAPPRDPVAAALLDVREGPRLAGAAAAAPLGRVLARVPGLAAALLPELSRLHRNPLLDPASPAFEKEWALDAWRLAALRVRPAEPEPGVNLVYRAAAAEDAYLRVRFAAPRRSPLRPEEKGPFGPAAVAALLRDTLLAGLDPRDALGRIALAGVGAGAPAAVADPALHAKGVAALVARVLDPASGFRLAGVDHSGRAGGGSARDAADAYLSGDGWAFESFGSEGALSPLRVVTSLSGTPGHWEPVCASRYRYEAPGYVAGVGPLCTGDGLVSAEREKVGSALLFETSALSASFRTQFAVRETPAVDVRRVLFGESGMTCIACHTRDYDVGGPLAWRAAHGDGPPPDVFTAAAPVARTFYALTPAARPVPYLDALEVYERCALGEAFAALGVAGAFACPLQAK
jgi:hypothetical protein